MKMSTMRKTCWNTSAIKLTDEGGRAKSDFPRVRPLNKIPELFTSSGLFLFYPKFRRNEPGRRVPSCAFCTLLVIFPLKICAKLPLDIFPIVWYNIIVVKREGHCASQFEDVTRLCESPKLFEKVFQNLLTNYHFCGIIIMSRGTECERHRRKFGTETTPRGSRTETMSRGRRKPLVEK